MPVDGDFGDQPSEPTDRLVIALRAYVRRAPKKPKPDAKPSNDAMLRAADWKQSTPRVPPSDWVLVFDCESRTTPDQRLRFGAYQLRYEGQVWERGAFYEPEVLAPEELAVLRQCIADEEAPSGGARICLRTRAGFVDEIFYRSGYPVGAQIVGFNLPVDLSRLAVRRARVNRRGNGAPDWSGPLGPDKDHAADLTACRELRSSNCCGLR